MLSHCSISENPSRRGGDSTISFYIVECEEQEYSCAPTEKALELLELFPRQTQNGSDEQPADTFLAASLADIQGSDFYPLSVRYAQQRLPETLTPSQPASSDGPTKGTSICNCTSVLALVSSTKVSHKEAINEKGTTVTTHGVKDLLADDGREYTLTAHCTTDTHMDSMLTPPRRASQ